MTDLRDKLRQTEVISPERTDDELDADAVKSFEDSVKEADEAQKNKVVNK